MSDNENGASAPGRVSSARERWEAERQADGPLVTLTLTTRVPSKWVAEDRETGDRWEWRDGTWKRETAPASVPSEQ